MQKRRSSFAYVSPLLLDGTKLITIVGIVLSLQGYGDNLTKFQNQVPQPERLLFSNEMLNRVVFSKPSEKKIKVALINHIIVATKKQEPKP